MEVTQKQEMLAGRPMLTDPKEFDIIRSIYFEDHNPRGSIDQLELFDRRSQGKNRNQSR